MTPFILRFEIFDSKSKRRLVDDRSKSPLADLVRSAINGALREALLNQQQEEEPKFDAIDFGEAFTALPQGQNP